MRSTVPSLRRYATADLPAVMELWSVAVGTRYPLRGAVLRRCLEAADGRRPSVVAACAWDGDSLVAFGYITSHDRAIPDSRHMRLQAVVVHPAQHRRGIGSTLAQHLLTAGGQQGAATAEVGGGSDYLWPGIPIDLPGAVEFAHALGFKLGGTSFDLRSTAESQERAPATASLLAGLGVHVEPASPETVPALLALVHREFDADWHLSLTEFLSAGGSLNDLLTALDPDGAIVGFVRIHTPDSHPVGPPLFWAELRGPDAGGLGPIGVARSWRGRGLGSGLLGSAVLELARRGSTDVVIDFTDRLGFYETQGFVPWMAFRHAAASPAHLAQR